MAEAAIRARSLQRRLEELANVSWPSSPLPATARSAYVPAAASADWPGVAAIAKEQRREARSALGQISRLQAEVRRTSLEIATNADDLLTTWVRPDRKSEWPQVRAQLVATLKPQTGRPKAESLVDGLGATTARTIRARMNRPVADLDEFLAQSAEQWRSLLVGARLAEGIVALNTRRPRALPPAPGGADPLDPLSEELTERLTKVREALGSGDQAAVRERAHSLSVWARGAPLDDAARRAADLSAMRRRDAQLRWTFGPSAQAAGELIRNLILAHAIGVTLEGVALSGGDRFEQWRAANGLPLVNKLGSGRRVTIAKLASDPMAHDGKEVIVEGVVGSVVIRHVRRKVLSSVPLLDEGGDSVTVGIEHIKLDSGGLAEGAYSTFAGTYSANDPVFATPTLRVGRHSFVDESQQSFLALATHLTRHVVTPVAHGLRYSSSWERGLSGANNQLRYGTWLAFERGL